MIDLPKEWGIEWIRWSVVVFGVIRGVLFLSQPLTLPVVKCTAGRIMNKDVGNSRQLGRQPTSDALCLPLIKDLVDWKTIPPVVVPHKPSDEQLRDLVQTVTDALIGLTSTGDCRTPIE
jgi:hypothetical protein